MSRYVSCALLCVGIFWFTGDLACAWEFKMGGAFTSTYEYYSQQGSNGFFGRANVDRSAGTAGTLGLKPGDFASLNGWVGKRAKDLVTGTDSSQQYPILQIFPEIRINPAIRFRGKYRLGNYGDPNASDYFTNTRPGVDVATSDGQWTLWWITAQTPWGTIVFGKRPEEFGTGLQYDGSHNATGEGMLLVSDNGPLRIALAFQPFWQEAANQRLGLSSSPYYNLLDKSGVRQQSTRAFMTYRSGAMDFGATYMVFRWHAGPESQNLQAARSTFVPYDDLIRHGCVYMKYFDGGVFLNTETAYWNESINLIGRAPFYNESWRCMVETGAVMGPAKVSFLYAFMPGADRRNGALIDRQSYVQAGPNAAFGIFQPYTYLLGYAYGSGVNAFDLDRQGYINEAWVAAARLDYAVAANLNVFGSFLWAERSSHGHGFGYIRPAQKFTVTRIVNAAGNGTDQVAWSPYVNYRDNANAPTIPDNALGWEVTAGLDWKLLENLQLTILGAFWQPGKWFNYACIDRSVQNWDTPTAANRWGTNPDRTIDPVVGVQVEVNSHF
ncbi:hypothetical protein [Desulfomonile tiedjei]|uniref:Porin n=1 Tax=Desulfomonile tiedjei (strain ATCC 49306 / DSM 6799 / DCB-1) TaxID=706587 RepID=I4C4S2_DESTA|nr:hypothetical protein [Desulfomonile tiedjei]AFM24563.1 hypothetical protein Desti_1855 [Desulfomonile tiedjei DSM 6799]